MKRVLEGFDSEPAAVPDRGRDMRYLIFYKAVALRATNFRAVRKFRRRRSPLAGWHDVQNDFRDVPDRGWDMHYLIFYAVCSCAGAE